MQLTPLTKQLLSQNKDEISTQLAIADAEERLVDFIPIVWPVIEPGRTFVPGYAVDAICEHLEAVTAGDIRRLVINVPPGCMKSLTTEVLWPIWEWGPRNMPHTRYVRASYSDALTTRDNLRARRIILSEVYQKHWGDRVKLVTDQNAKMKFETDKTGFMIATSVGGLGTGERGDRFVIDDPHNIKDGESTAKREEALQWFSNVVPTRINDGEHSAIIVIMQRVHDRDVSGLILKEELGYDWLCLPMEYEAKHRCFTPCVKPKQKPETVASFRREGEPIPRWLTKPEVDAELEERPVPGYKPKFRELYEQDWRTKEGELLWPERFSERHLEEDLKPQLRSWGGSYAEAGQLQQRPAPRAGGTFQRKDFQFLDQLPDDVIRGVRGWDLAGSKGDRSAWSVGLKMLTTRSGALVIADVWRYRATPHELDEGIKSCAVQDGRGSEQSLPQDPGQAGLHQKAHIATVLAGHDFHFSPESGSKEDRATPLASQSEAGNLYLIRAPWNDVLINEYCLFPNGEWMDQVDAGSRAYMRLTGARPSTIGAAPIVIGGGGASGF